MFYLLLIGLCLFAHNSFTMSKVEKNEQAAKALHAAQLVEAINERKKEKHEKIVRLTFHEPFPVQVTREQFEEVRVLCKPEYEPVLAHAIENKVISAQMYYESEYKVPVKINLLFEAMDRADKSKNTSDQMRFAAVVTLIKNGANPNQKGGLYEDEKKERHGRGVCSAQLSLKFAEFNPKLVKVLLTHGAIPSGQMLLSLIFTYNDLQKYWQEKLYQSLQHLLDHGADVNKSCYWEPYYYSPLEYARARGETDLVKLFEVHVNKHSTK